MSKRSPPRSSANFYSALHLRNFRGFKRAEGIRLAPLTFLVGPNSSGKSSILDAFLFLAQSHTDSVGDIVVPKWSGSLVDLGAYSDVVFGHKQNLRICIGFEVTFDSRDVPWGRRKVRKPITTRVLYEFGSSSVSKDPIGRLKYMEIGDIRSGRAIEVSLRSKGAVFVKAFGSVIAFSAKEQLKRPRWYSLADWLGDRVLKKGKISRRGDGTAIANLRQVVNSFQLRMFFEDTQRVASGRNAPKRWYPRSQPTPEVSRYSRDLRLFDSVDPGVISDQTPSRRGWTQRIDSEQVAKTLRRLDIAKSIETTELSPYHSSINVHDSLLNIRSKLIDVGYGASQVIPVIRACLSHNHSPLCIEQPEIHLHPRAQGVVAELICETSARRQVVVETHSEHMINRARLLIAQGKLDHRDVIINYVTRTKKGCEVQRIEIGPDGEFINEWPEGFFDERYEDTMRLLELKQDQNLRA